MNWKSLIAALREAGMTQVAIGREIGLSQPAVSDIQRGRVSAVTWEVGQALIALHRTRCGGGKPPAVSGPFVPPGERPVLPRIGDRRVDERRGDDRRAGDRRRTERRETV